MKREGAFAIYPADEKLEIVGYTSCGGCPGGNVEYTPAEMIKNGAEAIHLATGLIVGYPPCPRIKYFKSFIEERFKIPVVMGTHPIPQKYYITHSTLGTWKGKEWSDLIALTLSDEKTRLSYD
jgi:predicted metal-binding protein